MADELRRKIISLQLVDEEVDRFYELERRGKERNKLYSRSALLREMIGLEDYGLTSEEDRLYFLNQPAPPIRVEHIKLVGRVSAGKPIAPVEAIELVPVLSTDVAGLKNPRALLVEGDSMIDAGVFDGDTILVDDCSDPRNRIVVALIDEKATLKRWRQKGDSVVLEPANPDYPPKTYSPKKRVLLSWYGMLIKVLRSVEKPEVVGQEDADAA